MKGIVVGCDRGQEWLLPWWWGHYAKSNAYPVAFADFGMSEAGLAWCKERGTCLRIPHPVPLKEVSPAKKALWESSAGSGIWPMRPAWFKKPLACLHSPFPLSLWIDLDCEVRGPLAPLFQVLELGIEMALARDVQACEKNRDETVYNSGIIAFRQGAAILSHWIEQGNEEFMGDQDALSCAIHLFRPPFFALPQVYNWTKNLGPNPDAVILHYIGPWKLEILNGIR